MNFRDYIGLHIRLKDSATQAIQEALALRLKVFQFFLSPNQKNKDFSYISLSQEDKKQFIELAQQYFTDVYIHTSYWINAASGKPNSIHAAETLLKKEIQLAKKLELNKLVLHPGSATGHPITETDPYAKQAGIDSVTKILNTILKSNPETIIILENTAHGNRTIGSDLQDFSLIKKNLDFPEQIRFCLDFAHAYAHGYDLEQIDTFLTTIDNTMGLNALELIHFNDSQEKFGTKKDKHAYPGYGLIGKKILKQYLHHPKLQKINKIVELPQTSIESYAHVIEDICSW